MYSCARRAMRQTEPLPRLFSVEPFSPEQIEAFRGAALRVPTGVVRHPAGPGVNGGAPARVISLPERELPAFFDAYAYDVTPVSDDAPFFWHFARFRDLLGGGSPNLQRGLLNAGGANLRPGKRGKPPRHLVP